MQNIKYTTCLRAFSLLFLLLIHYKSAFGQLSSHVVRLDKDPNSSVSVVVGTPTSVATVNAPEHTGTLQPYDQKVFNRHLFYIDLNYPTFPSSAKNVKIKVKVNRSKTGLSSDTTFYMEVNFQPNMSNNPFNQKQLIQYYGFYSLVTTIEEIFVNGTSVSTLPEYLVLQNEIIVDVQPMFLGVQGMNSVSFFKQLHDKDCDAKNESVTLSWSAVPGALEYQLEWLHINDYSYDPNNANSINLHRSPANLSYNFTENATRISTAQTNYNLNLVFDRGWVVYRVRALGLLDKQNPQSYYYSAWTLADAGTVGNVSNDKKLQIDNSLVHENALNWQYATTYAEEGKRKEVISYFDGSLRNRQTVTQINSDDNTVVGQTIYDAQGRPAVQVLPVPVLLDNCSSSGNAALRYYPKFNRFDDQTAYNSSHFEVSSEGTPCAISAAPMDENTGAALYYSPNNPKQNNAQGYVPDANGYPFTQVEYTPDNTGRIRRQSGVGATFQLGSGHETKYFYAQPNQLELNRLFGSEVGYALHYKKNMVIDANGQVSISYLDQEGRVIATALAGNAPSQLSALSSDATATSNLTINALGAENSSNLPNTEVNALLFNTQLALGYTTNLTFNYNFSMPPLTESCLPSVCFDCVYELTLELVDECGLNLITSDLQQKIVGKFTSNESGINFHGNCVAPLNGTPNLGTITLENVQAGTYSLNKILRLSQTAQEAFVEAYINNPANTCVKSFDDFLEEEMDNIDTSACNPTCESCLENLGSLDNFIIAGGTPEAYFQAKAACDLLCMGNNPSPCELSLMAMQMDMMPHGQYAAYLDPEGDQLNFSFHPLSILNPNHQLPNALASWRKPITKEGQFYYRGQSGDTSRIYLISNANGWSPQVLSTATVKKDAQQRSYIYAEELQHVEDFIDLFDYSWTASLVTYHPEWCYYQNCLSFDTKKQTTDAFASVDFDNKLIASTTFEQAVNNKFLNADYAFLFNSALPVVSISNPIEDWFTPPANNPQNGTRIWDAFAYFNPTEAAPCNVYGQQLSDAFTQYTVLNGSTLSMAQFAAYTARCGSFNVGLAPAACFDFGKMHNGVYDIEILNQEWGVLKSIYLAKKKALQQMYLDCKALDGCNQYGGCIGQADYQPGEPLSPYAGNSSHTTNVNAPCGQYTMHLYAEKQRRFPRNENLVSQIEANSSEYDFYLQSGLCPIDFALENLLTELVSNQQLTSNGISLNNTSSFFGIFCAINNLQNPGTIPTIAQQATISSNNDTLYLDWINQQIPQRVNRITLVNNDPVLTWTDFTHLQKLRVINDTTFKIYAIKAANGLLIDSTRLTGYISNLQLGACAFETTCTTNQVGLDLQHLFNVLATNNQIFPVTPLSIQEIVVGSDTLNLQTTALSAAASYSGTLYYVNALPSGGSLWIGYQQGSNNYGLEIKVTQIADPLFFSSSVPAYYSNWRSTSENSFKVDVYDSTGNFTVISGVLLRHHPTLPLAGIPSGYCSTPQSSQCRTKAHRTFEDFARLLPDVLKTQSSGGNFNFDLFNSIHFTQLIASQLPASLSATSSTYNATTDTLLIQAGDCEISLYLPGAVNLVHVTQIGEMAVSGAADPTGNYFDFTLDVTVNYQGQTLYKQLKGHSCLPLKACPPCQQTKLLAEDKNELGDYSGTFSGQSSQNGSSDCDSLYAAYLAYYATTSYYQAGIPAVSKDRFEPCLKLVRPSDECYAAYDQYLTCADGFNKWAGGPANYAYRIDTPFVALPSFLQANVCNCIDNYCARLQKIKDGLVTFSSQTDFNTYLSVAAVCPQPCDRVDDSTGMVWINIPADSVELVAGNNCVEALINQAYFSATLRYENYLDSLKGALNQRYRNHCMGIQESLTYSYTDKQHHYTLYYYDQAGNLIKTVPPAGVELLAITNDNDALNLQINNDRKFNTKNVFTSHRLVTRYEYNSLNQLVAQFTPDTDPMQPFELYLTNGLPAQLVTNRIQMLNEMVGYLAGEIGNRGYLFRTTDGGVTWNRISSIVGTDFNKVRMISANVGFAVGNQGAIFKTADGGQTWDMISLHNLSLTTALPNLNDIDYHSNASLPNVVTIVGDGGLVLRSLDLNTFRRTNTITSTRLLSISNDGTTQLILAENSSRNLFYSMACTGVDSIYTASGTSFRGLELYAIDSLSSNLVIAAGRDGRLYTKAWAAPTAFWNQLHNNLTEDITDLRFFDANEGIAISDCHLYRTFDGGLNWTLIDNHVYNSLDKTVDRVAIVAVGDDGRIALCLKGSASPTPWIIPSGTSEKLHAAWITRETSGTANTLTLAVSANNTIRYCWDISQAMPQWNVFTQPVNETVLKFCLKKTNGQTQTDGLIQTDANKLYRFKINGASTVHQAISLPQGTGVILMNKAPNYDDYFVVTNNYYLMRLSLNTSNNFVTSTTMLNSSVFANKTAMLADKDTVVMVGNYPVHIFRNAAGTTYSSRTQATEFATTKLTSIIRHSNQNTWVSAGEDGTLYYLSGTSWVQVPTLVNNRFNRLRANANDLLIAGNNGYLKGWKFNTATNVYNKTIDFQTTTGLPLEGAISEHLYDLVFSGNQLWVVGQNGRYLFTPDYSTTALGLFTKGNQDLRGIALAPSGSSPISVGSNAAVLLHQWSYALENTRLFIPPVKALHFYDAQYGTIGASRFTVRQTSDGGMTWKNVAAVNVAHTLNYTPSAVFMVSPTKTVLFGNGTTLNEPMRIVNLQATRIMTGNRNIRAVDKTDNFLVLINQPTTTMSLLVMDLNNNDAITSIGTFTSFDGYDLKVNSKKQLYIVGQQGFRCYNWNGVVGSNATLGFSVATGIFGNRKLNAIGMMDNYAMAVVGDNGAFYHSTDPSINSAGLLTGISWSVRTGVHTSGIDPHFVTAQNQIHLRTIAFSNSTHAVYGGTYTSNYLSTPTEPMVRYLYTAPSRFSARFFYDRLGRLVVSQNARQYNNSDGTGRKYSYSLYDALGRVVEAGEKTSSATNGLAFKDIFGTWVSNYYNPQVIDDAKLLAWIAGSGARREVTKSYYDQTVITGLPSTFTPDPLTQRKRITHVTYEETFDGNDQTYDHATHYDYDIHGNVKTLLQDNRKMATTFTALASQRYKRMDYRYDLVSGNVHRMSVQNGEVDQWHHAYRYDADNRIVAAYTNEHTPMLPMQRLSGALETELTENEDWENDAKYYYYAHGPLARTEIGNNNLQGYDYLYNLQGWMKGINAIENTNDPGNDGTAGVNSYFGKDLTAFSLSYFNGDYAPINASAPMASVNNAS
ncbi:MAG: hypothetical protein RL264_2222, partial [Bacteroidota bacterium]